MIHIFLYCVMSVISPDQSLGAGEDPDENIDFLTHPVKLVSGQGSKYREI